MAAFLVDLDGSTFEWGTQQFLPGALHALQEAQGAGHQLVFVTQRSPLLLGRLKNILKNTFPGSGLVTGVTSPRILINDEGAVAINHPTNAPFSYDLNQIARDAGG